MSELEIISLSALGLSWATIGFVALYKTTPSDIKREERLAFIAMHLVAPLLGPAMFWDPFA